MRLNRVVLSVLMASGCAGASAEMASSMPELLKSYVEVGVVDGQYKATPARDTWSRLATVKDGSRYHLQQSLQFSFVMPWSLTRVSVPIMSAVADDLGRVCRSGAGELSFTPRNSIDEPNAGYELRGLIERQLYGRFVCTGGTQPFEVETQSGKTVTESVIPPKVSWSIVLAIAPPEMLLKIQEGQRKRALEAEAFQQELKPGASVSVSAMELPANAQYRGNETTELMLRPKKHFLCGLVTDVKPEIVQVQFAGGLAYVPLKSIRPVKKRVFVGHSLPLSDWEDWCFAGG